MINFKFKVISLLLLTSMLILSSCSGTGSVGIDRWQVLKLFRSFLEESQALSSQRWIQSVE